MSKVISINNIYNSVIANQQALNDTGIAYDVARLFRILLDFQPIEYSPLTNETTDAFDGQKDELDNNETNAFKEFKERMREQEEEDT